MGAFGFWADTHKVGSAPLRHGLGIAGLIVAYAFLGEPLGFVPSLEADLALV